MIETLNGLAGSAFVALILAMVACVFLYRLYVDERRGNRALEAQHWLTIAALTDGLKDNNRITERALDVVERARA